jgi:hypothetical protein
MHDVTARRGASVIIRRMDVGGWFYEVAGERRGPVALDELRRLVHAGTVGRDTKVWAEGMAEPTPAGRLAVLFPPAPEPWLRWLLPVGRSPFAIAAGYLGLLSFIPFVGYVAILIAVLAIVDLRRHPEKSGWGRVIFGLLIAIPMSLLYTVSFVQLVSH